MANTVVKIEPGFDLMITGANGLILRDNQSTPHYWRLTVTVLLGIPSVTLTDLGTTLPT